jgi:hypothetical protein
LPAKAINKKGYNIIYHSEEKFSNDGDGLTLATHPEIWNKTANNLLSSQGRHWGCWVDEGVGGLTMMDQVIVLRSLAVHGDSDDVFFFLNHWNIIWLAGNIYHLNNEVLTRGSEQQHYLRTAAVRWSNIIIIIIIIISV